MLFTCIFENNFYSRTRKIQTFLCARARACNVTTIFITDENDLHYAPRHFPLKPRRNTYSPVVFPNTHTQSEVSTFYGNIL